MLTIAVDQETPASSVEVRAKGIIARTILFVTCFIVLPSYVIHYYIGVQINELFAVLGGVCVLIALRAGRWRTERSIIYALSGLWLLGVLGSLASGAWSQLLMVTGLAVNVLIAAFGWRLLVDATSLKTLLRFATALLVGAVIAVAYAASGGPALSSIDLVGRESYFYLSTFTNSVWGNLIRPAGLFDEPGALAMYLTIAVALNEAFRRNRRWSAIVLFGGLISGSLAMLFIAVSYLLFSGARRALYFVLVAVVVTIGAMTYDENIASFVDRFFLKRVELVDGRLSGDNRSHQVESFFDVVDVDITLRGAKVSGYEHFTGIDQSSHPFSIYFGYGIFVWIPYAAIILWLLFGSLFFAPHLRFSCFALFLTLLQRPYIYSMYWGLMIAVLLVTIYRLQRRTSQSVDGALEDVSSTGLTEADLGFVKKNI